MLKRTCRIRGIKRWSSRKIIAISKKKRINVIMLLNDPKYRELINDIVFDKVSDISIDKYNIDDDNFEDYDDNI